VRCQKEFKYPLPAIIVSLVLDGIDQTLLHTQLSSDKWDSIEHTYQGYDKALDVYYLALAYLSTLRNWRNIFALEVSRFLWYYRLVGVTLFEILHDNSAPDSWRWLLLVFPNVFEYFFICYETVRLRWDPRRLSRRLVLGLAAFLWIFVKLPQEWWIHIAKLDFTDFASEHGWVLPTIVVLIVAACGGAWWAMRTVLPPKDHDPQFVVRERQLAPLNAGATIDAAGTSSRAPLFGWPLTEKIALIGLLSISFAEVLPRSNARPSQVVVVVAVFVAVDALISMAVTRLAGRLVPVKVMFGALLVSNLGIVELLHLLSGRFQIEHALFFVFLLSLIVSWYDRCRPHYDRLIAEGTGSPGSGDRSVEPAH
jgi:hypothetical protein